MKFDVNFDGEFHIQFVTELDTEFGVDFDIAIDVEFTSTSMWNPMSKSTSNLMSTSSLVTGHVPAEFRCWNLDKPCIGYSERGGGMAWEL